MNIVHEREKNFKSSKNVVRTLVNRFSYHVNHKSLKLIEVYCIIILYNENCKINIRFRCTNRSCNVTIIVNDKLNEIIETKNFPRNHSPYLKNNSIKLDIIKTAVKRKGTENLHTKPNKIILKEIRQSGFETDI
ncbi:hypothetical protein QTP88_004795 [Uroleucon formosanum]